MKEFIGLAGIDEFLKNKSHGAPISIDEINYIIEKISAKTPLTDKQTEEIIILFLEEIRSAVLNGEIVYIKDLGTIFVSSPKTTNTKRKIFLKFKASKNLKMRLNGNKKSEI